MQRKIRCLTLFFATFVLGFGLAACIPGGTPVPLPAGSPMPSQAIPATATFLPTASLTPLSSPTGTPLPSLFASNGGDLTNFYTLDTPGNTSIAFSPDGLLFATDEAGQAWILFSGIPGISQLPSHTIELSCAEREVSFAYSPDGQEIAYGCNGRLEIWDARQGEILTELRAAKTHDISALAYSADGKYLAAGTTEGVVSLWDAASGERLGDYDELVTEPPSSVRDVAFSPGGRYLAWTSRAGELLIWDLAARQKAGRLLYDKSILSCPTFSSDDSLVAYAVWHLDRVSTDIDILETKTIKLKDSFPGIKVENVVLLKFSPDDGKIMAVSARPNAAMLIFDLARRQTVTAFIANPDTSLRLMSAALSPDQGILAIGYYPHEVQFWATEPGPLH
ncbi:MAG TPA: WD40 repeat domain-containing protein [Anaerolineales bacterium]|nr:WD40 repeat domain-containing protein [Anaerolineales bacterium]